MPGYKHFNKDLHHKSYKVEHPDWDDLQVIAMEVWKSGKYLGQDDMPGMKKSISEMVDFDSLTSFCSEQVDSMVESLGLADPPTDIKAMLVTLIATGFVSGYKFHERKTDGPL